MCFYIDTFHIMNTQLATFFTSVIMALVMMLSPSFEVYAEICDSETEIELAESISPNQAHENVEQAKVINDKPKVDCSSTVSNLNPPIIINLSFVPVNRQKIFCNFRE